MIRALAIAILCLAPAFAAFEEDAPPPAPGAPLAQPEVTVNNFAVSHPQCRAWNNGCTLCQQAEKASVCSTPGIACTPKDIVCTDPKAPE